VWGPPLTAARAVRSTAPVPEFGPVVAIVSVTAFVPAPVAIDAGLNPQLVNAGSFSHPKLTPEPNAEPHRNRRKRIARTLARQHRYCISACVRPGHIRSHRQRRRRRSMRQRSVRSLNCEIKRPCRRAAHCHYKRSSPSSRRQVQRRDPARPRNFSGTRQRHVFAVPLTAVSVPFQVTS
jgi:hypothetical protein